ncbi:hypothetical protein Tco_0978996 [Tanacetum coccineum]|uniref:Uncharacterized protein n=1 Tax=Tanacetum coccineum TaxID=301880 RepID=A0ABQ5EPU3_9ASTR
MDENIDDLTIEQYFKLTQENQSPSVGMKFDDMTIAEYLEYEEAVKTQDYDGYQTHSTNAGVSTINRDHLSPHHKSFDLPLKAKTNPYFQASQSPIHPKITKTPTKHTKGNEIRKEREQSDEGLGKGKGKDYNGRSRGPLSCGETKTRAIIEAMVNKLPEEWFQGLCKDKDDLEGIIDYLEPTLYDGFIDPDDEAYKQRRNKLLGMPYTESPPILNEEAEITRYSLGARELKRSFQYQKEILCKTRQFASGKTNMCTKWASYNPYFNEYDGGNNSRENKEYWESSNDDKRTTLEWEDLSFDDWVRVAFGKDPAAKRAHY